MVDRKAELPGPGEYRLRSEPDGPFFTIRPPLEAPEPEDLPGPGEYEAGTSGWDGPKYSMGGKAADKRPESDAFPGPGESCATLPSCESCCELVMVTIIP